MLSPVIITFSFIITVIVYGQKKICPPRKSNSILVLGPTHCAGGAGRVCIDIGSPATGDRNHECELSHTLLKICFLHLRLLLLKKTIFTLRRGQVISAPKGTNFLGFRFDL